MALQEHINSHLLGKVNNKTILSQKIETFPVSQVL